MLVSELNLPLIIGALAVVLRVVSQIRTRKNMQKYNFEVVSLPIFIMKHVLMAALIGAVAVILSSYRGLSWTIVIVAVAFDVLSRRKKANV